MNLEELQLRFMISRIALCWSQAGRVCLGSEIACALVGCNANVVILDRDQELAQESHRAFSQRWSRDARVRVYWRCAQSRNIATGK